MAVLIAEIAAFLLVGFLLYRYLWPFLRKMMEQRQDAIAQQVDESEEAERKLADAQQRYESAVEQAHNEAARIRDDARADSQRIREDLREQAHREVERIKERGAEQLAAQRDQIVRRLRAELGGLSMALAEQIVAESLSDEASRTSSVDRFLDDLDQLPAGADRETAATGGGAH